MPGMRAAHRGNRVAGIQFASARRIIPMSATLAPMPAVTTAHCGERLKALPRGIEKESLRVRPDGTLATTPHAAPLGSALKHPHITTDFSESQLELITGVQTSAEDCATERTENHQI